MRWADGGYYGKVLSPHPPKRVTIILDSECTLAVLESTKKSEANRILVERVRGALKGSPHHFQFILTPSHTGLYGNEMADKLAGLGAKEATRGARCPAGSGFAQYATQVGEESLRGSE